VADSGLGGKVVLKCAEKQCESLPWIEQAQNMVPCHVSVNTVEFHNSTEFHESQNNCQLFQVSVA
jgi:hypothetical protein